MCGGVACIVTSNRLPCAQFDAEENTRVNIVGIPSVSYPGGSVSCVPPDGSSGIGECSGTLSAATFTSDGVVSLSLLWPNAGTVALDNFASVSVQQEPQWSRDGGWNVPTSSVTPGVAFGVVLPYEDVYISAGASRATVTAAVYMKTHMAEDSVAERQVAVGKFKLVFPSPACMVVGDSGRHGAFATWEVVSGLGAGAYGLLFRNGQVESYSALMVTISLSCTAGTHQIGIETMSHADSNGLSFDPATEYAASVGRGQGYVTRAEVLVKATTEDVHVFAYPHEGRANLNNLAVIGQPTPTLYVRVDSISNSPYVSRSVNVACEPSASCTYTPALSAEGKVSLSVSHSGTSDTVAAAVVKPLQMTLTAEDNVLSAIGCLGGGDAVGYQSTQLRLRVDGLDMTHLSEYSSSDPSVAEVVGSRVHGRQAGTAVISATGGASVSITVDDTVVQPQLVARIVTAMSAASRTQTFNDEGDVGWMYVHATYTNGDAHTVDMSDLAVTVMSSDRLYYSQLGSRQKVGIVQDALAGSSCTDSLLRVALLACNASAADGFQPPLDLQLPTPLGLDPLVLTQTNIAPPASFARSGALSNRPQDQGQVSQASVEMSDGLRKNMLGDARVSLESSDPSCVEVVSDLSSASGFDYRALDSGSCTSATITARFTLGSWEDSTSATVYIVRHKAMSLSAALFPSCGSPASTLYTLGCASPPLRQRAQFSAVYELESDDNGYSASGNVNLGHGDVARSPTNLKIISGVTVYEGEAAGAASFAISLRTKSATLAVTISDTALALSAIEASVDATLVTSLTIRVDATFSGEGVSCRYTNGVVRGSLGTSIQDVATFEVGATYSSLLSVVDTGTLTALATHWAKAPVTVRNKCAPSLMPQEVSVYVNKVASAGTLDMGEASLAPLQAGGSLNVKLWFDLSRV